MNKKDLKLQDFEGWQSANKSKYFSLFDYISAMSKTSQKLTIDSWVAFSEIFLPSFIENDGHILVEECFKEKEQDYIKYIKEGLSKKEIETWINNISLDGLLYDLSGETDEICTYIGEKIKLGWELKLKNDFPNRKFTVALQKDEDVSDFMLTCFEVN